MRDVISIRADFEGKVEHYLLKLSKTRRVLLPGGFLLLRVTGKREKSVVFDFDAPVKLSRAGYGWVVGASAGEDIAEGDTVLTLMADVPGKVQILPNQIKIAGEKPKTHKRFPEMELLVENGADVKAGMPIGLLKSPIEGVLVYQIDNPEKSLNNLNRVNLIKGVEIFNGIAYSIPEDFKVFVGNDVTVESGKMLAEGEDSGAEYDIYLTSKPVKDEDEILEAEESDV